MTDLLLRKKHLDDVEKVICYLQKNKDQISNLILTCELDTRTYENPQNDGHWWYVGNPLSCLGLLQTMNIHLQNQYRKDNY